MASNSKNELQQRIIEKIKEMDIETLKYFEKLIEEYEECLDIELEEQFSSQESSIFNKEYYVNCYNPAEEI